MPLVDAEAMADADATDRSALGMSRTCNVGSRHAGSEVMYLTVRKYRNVQGDRQQIIDKVNRGFVPLISKIDGFVDYYCIFDEDGTLLSVSVYRDARGADESVRAAAKWVEQNLAEHLPETPEVISGEVFAHQRGMKQKAA